MDKMRLIWSGETELPAGWKLQPHAHDYFHLAYVRRGDLVFHAGGLDYPLSEGSLILISPFVVHAVPEDSHNLCSQYEVFFRLTDPELSFLLKSHKVLVLHGASHLEDLFSYVCANYSSDDPLQAYSVNAFLCAILSSLLVGKPGPGNSSDGYVDSSRYSPLVQRIIRHVEKTYDKKYELSALALALGFNKNYLCTVFRRETGVTISEYLNYHRIRRVLISLQYNGYNREVPIHELADQFGYGNPSYFNRVFKTYTGLTPIEFIKAFSGEGPGRSAFQKYYIEYLDLKRYPIRESLAYMRGLKAASETGEPSRSD
ncbi:MAG: AraC family transcriptional regulator [Clostridia bacterium]|nr:AraC family transcriptional regulator [Clostridia bacterium]